MRESDEVIKRRMAESLKNGDVYYCTECEYFFGIFCTWQEAEYLPDATICPVCSNHDEYKLLFMKGFEGANI